MKSTVLIAAIAAGLTLTAIDATAQGRGMPMDKPDFATLDADGNGGLSLDELKNAGAQRFAATDTDGNGSLSAAELVAEQQGHMADRAAEMIKRMDANSDGELQADEMKPRGRDGGIERMFDHIDADQNGEISPEEFDAAGQDRRDHGRHGDHGRDGGKDNG